MESHRLRFVIKLLYLFLFFFFFSVMGICSTISFRTTCLGSSRCQSSIEADLSFLEIEKIRDDQEVNNIDKQQEGTTLSLASSRRLLSGPGSSPPRCTSKCGSCTPCKPVHVPVPPGTPVTTEYYPEAWRCKCGNKLYLP